LFWNEDNWETKEGFPVYFWIDFKFPWIFKIFGYRLRSGNDRFPLSWEINGISSNHGQSDRKYTVLDEQKRNTVLSSRNAEKSFRIQNEENFDGFEVLFNENYEGKIEFCLNAIEIFGILKTIE
jgi:hypothetical protein